MSSKNGSGAGRSRRGRFSSAWVVVRRRVRWEVSALQGRGRVVLSDHSPLEILCMTSQNGPGRSRSRCRGGGRSSSSAWVVVGRARRWKVSALKRAGRIVLAYDAALEVVGVSSEDGGGLQGGGGVVD